MTDIASILIAALALAVSIVSMAISGFSVRVAREALEASREQFVRAGAFLDVRTLYVLGPSDEDSVIGIDAEVRNAGRTPTIITSVGLHAANHGYDEVVDHKLDVGQSRRYHFDICELAKMLGYDLVKARFVVETGHGEWLGEPLSKEMAGEVRRAIQRAIGRVE